MLEGLQALYLPYRISYWASSGMRSGRRSSVHCLSPLTLVLVGLITGFLCTMRLRHNTHSTLKPCSSQPTVITKAPFQVQKPTTNLPNGILNLGGKGRMLLVGVMTADKYIDTRAWTVWRTWAQTIPGRVIFFVSERTRSIHPELPIVSLPGVDDVYPPQKKSFMMLRWMAEHALDHFDWFLRADDDLYVRGDKLEMLLKSLNSSKPLFIGQAGLGKPHEYGQLSLADDENYCMGGPGIVLSKHTLSLLRPHLTTCLYNMYTTHEDVEIGRCARKYAGVTCTWSYEMQIIFYNNQSGSNAYTGDLNVADVHNAITMHPVKNTTSMIKLHNFVRRIKTGDVRFRSLQISRDVKAALNENLRLGVPVQLDVLDKYNDCGSLPTLLKFSTRKASEILAWDFLSPQIRYCSQSVNCPRHNSESFLRYALADIVRQVMDSVNRQSRQKGRTLVFKEILYGYHRVDPVHGPEYVLDLLLMYRRFKGRRVSIPVRRHTYIQQTYSDLEAIDDSSWRRTLTSPRHSESHSKSRVHIILPLAGRSHTFGRFLDHIYKEFLEDVDDPLISIHVVLFSTQDTSEDSQVENQLHEFVSRRGSNILSWKHLPDTAFNRALALNSGASLVQSDALLFLTDVDVLFTVDSIRRVILNTVRGKQVYFPMVFSEYSPNTLSPNPPSNRLQDYKELDKSMASEHLVRSGGTHHIPEDEKDTRAHFGQPSRKHGYFRHFGFGIAAIYKSDLEDVGGFDQDIAGWGMEDVQFFEHCLKSSSNLKIFRAPDPELVHVYHSMHCDPALPPARYSMCLGSMASSYASVHTLADIMLANKKDNQQKRTKRNVRRPGYSNQ